MRLFVAIPLSVDVEARLERFVERARPLADLRWARMKGLHLTLKFIGEVPEPELTGIESALRAVPQQTQFGFALRGLGWFPNARAPRVFWVGVEAPPALMALATDVDRELARVGIAAEQRPYAPHVTLARVPPRARCGALEAHVAKLGTLEFGSVDATQFVLYESRPSAGGHQHHALATFPLAKSLNLSRK